MRLFSIVAGVSIAVLALSGCSAGGSTGGEVQEGGTFTLAINADPGKLDPQMSVTTIVLQASLLAYDSLVSIDKTGEIKSQLASKWSIDGDTISLTMNDGITCSDGTPFTAKDAAANLNWIGDPANESPILNVLYPVGATAAASSDTDLTVTLASPAPFALNGLAVVPMVCGNAIDDRESLAAETHGTGPYVLSKATSGDQYEYTVRDGYTWGPDGASTATKGMPDTVVLKVVSSETTAANLLLSGDLNAATVIGSDDARLKAANLFVSETPTIIGEMWFNHNAQRPMSDKDVRLALAKSIDLTRVTKVLTSDKGSPGTAFAVDAPVACTGDSVSQSVPKFDPDAAASLLDDAGWKMGSDGIRSKGGKALEVTFVQNAALGDSGAAAAELTVTAWTELGAKVTSRVQDSSVLLDTLFGTGDWDVAWLSVNVSSPDQLVAFLSGPGAADGGSNFAGIDNADYAASVATAMALPGTDGCDDWFAGESALVRDADVIPFANQVGLMFGSGATFDTVGQVVPTTIRMVAK